MTDLPAKDLQLPPLGEAGTLTLVDELEASAARVRRLPEGAAGLLARVVDARVDLEKHIAARERAGSSADPRARAADRALDDAWGALQCWLLGWTRLPDKAHPRLPDARALYGGLFPRGLAFLTLEFKDQWTESQKRLDYLHERSLQERSLVGLLGILGGMPFLETVRAAHKAYGEALHLVPEALDPDAAVRRALGETHAALRDYLSCLAAAARSAHGAGTEAIAELSELLGPLTRRSSWPTAPG